MLIPIIDEVVKYGLEPNLIVEDRYRLLERDLIKIYSLSFDIVLESDDTDYPEFNKATVSECDGKCQK